MCGLSIPGPSPSGTYENATRHPTLCPGAQAAQPAVFSGLPGVPCADVTLHSPLSSSSPTPSCPRLQPSSVSKVLPPGMSVPKPCQVGVRPQGEYGAAVLGNLVSQLPLGPKTAQSAREDLRLKAPQGLWRTPYATGAENCPRTGQDADAIPSPLDVMLPMQCPHAPFRKLRGIPPGLVQSLHLVWPCGTGCNSEGMAALHDALCLLSAPSFCGGSGCNDTSHLHHPCDYMPLYSSRALAPDHSLSPPEGLPSSQGPSASLCVTSPTPPGPPKPFQI